MLEFLSNALGHMQESKGMLAVVLILTYGLGTVLTMIGGEVRVSWQERQYKKREEKAKADYDRISHGWNEENSDEWSLTNETYHAAGQRSLFSDWRDRVARAAEPVMEEYVPQRNWDDHQTVAWPQWTAEELAEVGRHRFDDTMVVDAMPVSPGQGYTPRQLRALVAQTGAFSVVPSESRELVGSGVS